MKTFLKKEHFDSDTIDYNIFKNLVKILNEWVEKLYKKQLTFDYFKNTSFDINLKEIEIKINDKINETLLIDLGNTSYSYLLLKIEKRNWRLFEKNNKKLNLIIKCDEYIKLTSNKVYITSTIQKMSILDKMKGISNFNPIYDNLEDGPKTYCEFIIDCNLQDPIVDSKNKKINLNMTFPILSTNYTGDYTSDLEILFKLVF